MTKGLKALENIKRERPQYFSTLYDLDMWKEDIGTIEKELKAFSIIKEKQVDIELFNRCKSFREYNYEVAFSLVNRGLIEEEFKLLKEVLK